MKTRPDEQPTDTISSWTAEHLGRYPGGNQSTLLPLQVIHDSHCPTPYPCATRSFSRIVFSVVAVAISMRPAGNQAHPSKSSSTLSSSSGLVACTNHGGVMAQSCRVDKDAGFRSLELWLACRFSTPPSPCFAALSCSSLRQSIEFGVLF